MIVVTAVLVPGGDWKRARTLSTLYIANDGTGTADRGNYTCVTSRKGATSAPIQQNWQTGRMEVGARNIGRVGEVRDFPRRSYNIWRLIIRALRACYPEER